jgi:ATP-binding cassette subfamily F protein uup
MENVGEGNDTVTINGRSRHIIGYLEDFLFTPDRSRSPVSVLSGGERNRLLLAKLFTRPSNVLVMDEPTNDLDVETLDLLEELLAEYAGTLLLVSHDREFLNNVVTSTLVLAGDGEVREYVGGYDDWLREASKEGQSKGTVEPKEAPAARAKQAESVTAPPVKPRKLTFKEARELEGLPDRLHALEAEQEELHRSLADPAWYRTAGPAAGEATARLAALDQEYATTYHRWEELEALRG